MVMQPPATSAYLRDYIERLKLEAKVLATQSSTKIAAQHDPIETYTHQILGWIRTLSPSQQIQSYTMNSIIRLVNLKGIRNESPSPQHIATALRKAGFQQMRSWKKADRNIRTWRWYAPNFYPLPRGSSEPIPRA